MVDNRLPPTLREKMLGEAIRHDLQDAINFLSFRDWLVGAEFAAGEWTIVARSSDGSDGRFYTFSALAEASERNLAQLLNSDEWDVMNDFGRPHYEAGGGRGLHYEPDDRREVDGVFLFPFTRLRRFNGYIANRFELDQEFLLYHNAFFEPESRSYKFVAEHGEIVTIARESGQDEDRMLEVATHHLRDYLAAKKCFLVRFHDHTRWSSEDVRSRIAGHTSSWHRTDESVFKLVISTEHALDDRHRALGALRGKDVVYPYAIPDSRHTDWYLDRESSTFERFLIRDKGGRVYEETCDPDKLSNYFVDRGTAHCLTPVCFERKVLQRYYAEPRRFTVSDHGLQCLDLWSMPFDINTAGLIEVWLYDLAKLPPDDQRHWKTFNVAPAGKTSEERFKRDFEAQWVDDKRDPVLNFQNALYGLQKATKAVHGEPLIRELTTSDAHLLKTLRVPVTDEQQELDAQIQALATATVDSLNAGLLEKLTGLKNEPAKGQGTLYLLEQFLTQRGLDENSAKELVKPLRAVQSLRSTGAAHRKGSAYHEALDRFGLKELSNTRRAGVLIAQLASALDALAPYFDTRV